MWEAVDEAKRLVTQSRSLNKETTTLNKETATLLEESRDIRDEHKEDRQAMAELLKQQKIMIEGLKTVQETFVLISERENRASQLQETSQNDLLFKLSQFEKRITHTEERINRRYDWRFVDYGVAAILGISAYVLLFRLVGPRLIAWVGQLIGS